VRDSSSFLVFAINIIFSVADFDIKKMGFQYMLPVAYYNHINILIIQVICNEGITAVVVRDL